MPEYSSQYVIYFDKDLEETARATANKWGTKRDVKRCTYLDATSFGPNSVPTRKLEDINNATRLVIVGHGAPDSRTIGNCGITPEQLAKMIRVWTGNIIVKRISLHMCYGGGHRKGLGLDDASLNSNWPVSPFKSFAYALAKALQGLAKDVTARTDVVAGTTITKNAITVLQQRTVGGRHQSSGDKYRFAWNATEEKVSVYQVY